MTKPSMLAIPLNANLNSFNLEELEETVAVPHPGKALLEAAAIDLFAELAPPQPSLEIIQGGNAFTLATLGNFSVILGKAKSRKTFYVTSLLASAIRSNMVLNAAGCLPADQRTVLSFDTEQGNHHAQKSARRVLKLAGLESSPNFKAYGLRKLDPKERVQAIEYALYNTPNLGFVVIDGIRDLIYDINNAEEATIISSKLLKWTEELNIHIVTVLHQNKGDNNARGHLGTELQNKAESVISVTKDGQNKDLSIVAPEYCREKEFEPFAFEIDEDTLPRLADGWSPKSTAASKPKNLFEEISTSTHLEILNTIFSLNAKPKYSELQTQIKLAVRDKIGAELGNNKVQEFITQYTNQGLIRREGKQKSPASYYALILPD